MKNVRTIFSLACIVVFLAVKAYGAFFGDGDADVEAEETPATVDATPNAKSPHDQRAGSMSQPSL